MSSVKSMPSREKKLADKAERIRMHGRWAASSVMHIGEMLSEAKQLLEHGEWEPWLKLEFDWDPRTARRFIRAYDCFKTDKLSDLGLDVSALYLLAQQNTPEPIRKKAIELAETEHVSHAKVKAMLNEYRSPTPKELQNWKEEELADEIEARAAAPVEWAERMNECLANFLSETDEELTFIAQQISSDLTLPVEDLIPGIVEYAKRDELLERLSKALLLLNTIDRGVKGYGKLEIVKRTHHRGAGVGD